MRGVRLLDEASAEQVEPGLVGDQGSAAGGPGGYLDVAGAAVAARPVDERSRRGARGRAAGQPFLESTLGALGQRQPLLVQPGQEPPCLGDLLLRALNGTVDGFALPASGADPPEVVPGREALQRLADSGRLDRVEARL